GGDDARLGGERAQVGELALHVLAGDLVGVVSHLPNLRGFDLGRAATRGRRGWSRRGRGESLQRAGLRLVDGDVLLAALVEEDDAEPLDLEDGCPLDLVADEVYADVLSARLADRGEGPLGPVGHHGADQ